MRMAIIALHYDERPARPPSLNANGELKLRIDPPQNKLRAVYAFGLDTVCCHSVRLYPFVRNTKQAPALATGARLHAKCRETTQTQPGSEAITIHLDDGTMRRTC